MQAAGVGRDAIHAQTGWFQGVDGKWRFEIDDSAAKLAGSEYSGGGITNFTGVDHPQLSAAYGEVPNVYGHIERGKRPRGSYLAGEGDTPAYLEAQGPDAQSARSIALHELQHDLQNKEGFARGASPKSFELDALHTEGLKRQTLEFKSAFELRRIADERGISISEAASVFEKTHGYAPHGRAGMIAGLHSQDKIQGMQARLDEIRNESQRPFGSYWNTAGEVEARNVETRMNMTAAERRATAPWLTQDVPDEQQIVRRR
jgi:hypothetical protein